MHREQLAYQAITVMGDCLLWFQRLCGLTNVAHAPESQANNRLFFLVQLSEFGKEGRRGKKKKPASARVRSHDLSSPLQPNSDIWAVPCAEVGFGIQSERRSNPGLLCSGGDKNSVSEVGSQEEPWL